MVEWCSWHRHPGHTEQMQNVCRMQACGNLLCSYVGHMMFPATQGDWCACTDVHMQSYFRSERFPHNLPADVWEPQWAHLASAGGAAVVLGEPSVHCVVFRNAKCNQCQVLAFAISVCLRRPWQEQIMLACMLCQIDFRSARNVLESSQRPPCRTCFFGVRQGGRNRPLVKSGGARHKAVSARQVSGAASAVWAA